MIRAALTAVRLACWLALLLPVGCALTHPTDPYAPVRSEYRGVVGARPEEIAQAAEAVTQLKDCTAFAESDMKRIEQIGHQRLDAG